MRVLVCSEADNASTNIRDRLLETGQWRLSEGPFRGGEVFCRGDDALVTIAALSIYDDHLSADLAATGWDISAVWFLSRHRAASGQPSLTVHPIGNHGVAEYGGEAETLSPAAAHDMGALLRRLQIRRDGVGIEHSVTYEATHHGPLMQQPSLFVELGSNEDWYDDVASGQVLAAAITDVLDGEGQLPHAPILVGVGGGHYVPRHTDLALAGEADFGHLLPQYAVDAEQLDAALLARAVAATPGATGVYVHKKGLKGPQRQRVAAWAETVGISPWQRPE